MACCRTNAAIQMSFAGIGVPFRRSSDRSFEQDSYLGLRSRNAQISLIRLRKLSSGNVFGGYQRQHGHRYDLSGANVDTALGVEDILKGLKTATLLRIKIKTKETTMEKREGRLEGKVAIITGGTSGIGASSVEIFAEEGARVMIAARGEEKGQELAERLGENVAFTRTDVTDEAQVKAMVAETVNRWGRLDVLFNNAGRGPAYKDVQDFNTDEFGEYLMLLLGSCFVCVKYAAPIMKQQRSGSIINTGSTAGITTDGSSVIYSAAKAGLIQATKVWATELAEYRVRVNCVSPGAVMTPIFWGGYDKHSPEENARRLEQLTKNFEELLPMKRAGVPEDIAYAALYLASDESLHTTGHNLMVDGGNTVMLRTRAGLIERRKKISNGLAQ